MTLRSVSCLLVLVVAVGAGRAKAEEIRGKAKNVDGDKGTITLTGGDADQTFNVAGDAKVVGLFGKKIKKASTGDLPGGLRGVKVGSEVTLTTDTKDAKSVVTQVKVEDLQPKVKKKKKKNKNK